MTRRFELALVLAMTVLMGAGEDRQPSPKNGADLSAPPIKVLFLGDRGHHHPADRAAQILPVLAGRGIDVTYTERLDDLNPATLARYDALLIYANITDLKTEQEKALIEYVNAGGGFVPVHCASYCFLNSPRYIALLGAQFQRHGTGEFETEIVDSAHPTMKGFVPFRTWDETYVHIMHNEKGRHVLQTRTEGGKAEPWTWVRAQGKGRVFYTAYGHDARTWQEPGFHDLIERGIRWASAKGEVFDSRSRVAVGLPPFTYDESPAAIPNYLPGRKWGTQGEVIRKMQTPLTPAESLKHLVVPPGFEPRLFASEPDIHKPLCMTWDHRGRLWIAESTDYPNTKRRDGHGRGSDRISVLEDTNGDGQADSFNVFAEGLNIPTGFLCHDGGVIMLQAPDTLFLKDTDGDGKADLRKVLFTGWGIRDTHAGPSNLRWGLDNWVWGIVGYSAFRGTVGGEAHSFGQGLFRFKPDGSKLEFIRSTNNNSWGVGFSEEGLVFGSTANGCPSVYMPIANRYYERVRGQVPARLESIAASNRFYPVTDKVRQVDWHGGFTAAAGHALYTARTYPPHYWNQTAFVAEPTGHLVATFTFERKGSDFAGYYGWNLVASDDEWTAPIAAEVGPDGHVWVIDWYNFIVQHNPTPHGFQTGKGNAYETPLRDKIHGRIYRIVYKDAQPSQTPRLDPDHPDMLVAALKHDNQFWRHHAQRLLIGRAKTDVVPALVELARDRSVDAIGLNAPAIHALWTLHGLGALSHLSTPAATAAMEALRHPSAGVRRNATQVLPRDDRSVAAVISAGLLRDEDAQVRLASLLSLADLPATNEAGVAVTEALYAGVAADDPWLVDAAIAAGANNADSFLKAIASPRKAPPGAPVLSIVERVAEHWARGAPTTSAGSLLAALCDGEPAVNEAILRGLSRGWPPNRPARVDGATSEVLNKLVPSLTPAARGYLVRLAGAWGDQALERLGAEIAASLLASVKNEHMANSRRIDAARQLIEVRPADETMANAILSQIKPAIAPELAGGLIDALATSKAPGAGGGIVGILSDLSPSVRSRLLRILLGRSDWVPPFVDWLEQKPARLSELALDQKLSLIRHPNREIAARVQKLLARGGGLPDRDRQLVIDRLAPELERGGDPTRGKLVFQQQCAKCHKHSGEGGQVGPDLSGMSAIPRRELIIHIFDPSRSVEGNFTQYTAATTDGRVISGLLASEATNSVELIDADGKRHAILRQDIDEMTASKKSLMPEGFEKQIPPVGLNDLLAFLTRQSKYRPLDLSKVATIVSTRGMFVDADAKHERLVFPDWSPKIVDGVPFVLVDPKGDKVPNVVLLYSPQGKFPPLMPRSVTIDCNSNAAAIHFLSGVAGWAYPFGRKGSVSLTVRLHFGDGQIEDHKLKNGVQFADYIRVVEVPGSKLAFRLGNQQIRYFRIEPRRKDMIKQIELIKGPDDSAPVVMAVTIEAS